MARVEPRDDADLDAARGSDFGAWQRELRVPQIRHVAFLTAGLYLLYALLEWRLAEAGTLSQWQMLRGLSIAAILISIGLLSFQPRYHAPMRALLLIAPVLAISGNLLLSLGDQDFVSYAPELYLALIWTFSVSGLTLGPATVSALISTSLILAFTALYGNDQTLPDLHLLWVGSAFAFGLLGAAQLERSSREMFLAQAQLQRQATFDDLTGLWNRRQLRDELAREIARSERNAAPLALIMLDIDHFKRVNDEHGHAAGDVLLRELAELLQHQVRGVDAVGRFGGEEFLIVLPDTRVDAARTVAEKLRATIESNAFSVGGTCTASFGVAEYRPSESLDAFIQRADAALYGAKRAGRNRVWVSGD
ncbi:GGDEF domain-containing protein [Wenzhouxiangella marina]|uniref:diguanylate cyclase n=1 Tax=Wenzhouxiangella marina TaxID=1579979 RepID=A0A0K0XZT0_9GAMM|nr:GGDEF domain-containing protein [Wenzhouxiangella marina]AKS43193.1 diguanylate cyclase [Wenzhouxiangella marina]MBB6087121.1 diguanylate cyclase (GGDEF)-like protein [Wenzhouxiangella marina]